MQFAEVCWRASGIARVPGDFFRKKRANQLHKVQPNGKWWESVDYPIFLHHDGGSCDRIRIFDLTFPIDYSFDWHCDYRYGTRVPSCFSRIIDIRDAKVVGDIKYIWEINRHQHLSAVAYSGRPDAALIVREAIRLWIEQNPYLEGVNWTSSLECALRLISWTMLYPLLRASFASDQKLREMFAASVYWHLSEMRHHLSLYSSANNHLIGELAGLYIGSVCFPWWQECRAWRKFSRELLEQEIQLQFAPDGVNREQAMSYQLFTMELLMAAMLIGNNAGENFSDTYRERLHAALQYVSDLATAKGDLPWFGDSDDARGFLLSGRDSALQVVMQLGALIFQEPAFARFTPRVTAAARAFLPEKCESLKNARSDFAVSSSVSGLRRDGGVAVMEAGAWKLVMDVGPLGYTSIAAHGHADALSLLVAVDDRYVIVDSGTYAYHSHPEWRSYFRGTAAHNTACVDGVDQSAMAGRFVWSTKAKVRLVEYLDGPEVTRVVAEHDGYMRLQDPVLHRRAVTLEKTRMSVVVEDTFICRNEHNIGIHWHISEDTSLEQLRPDTVRICRGRHVLTFYSCEKEFTLTIAKGDVSPILGWRSHHFNEKVVIPTLRLAGRVCGTSTLTTRITVD